MLWVEFHSKATRLPGHLRGIPSAGDRGESDGDVGFLAGLLEELGPGVPGNGFVASCASVLKVSKGRKSTGVNHPFRFHCVTDQGSRLG